MQVEQLLYHLLLALNPFPLLVHRVFIYDLNEHSGNPTTNSSDIRDTFVSNIMFGVVLRLHTDGKNRPGVTRHQALHLQYSLGQLRRE